jgi:hypothetical protein
MLQQFKFFSSGLKPVSLRVQNLNFRVLNLFRVDFKRHNFPSARSSLAADAITITERYPITGFENPD